ncbi:MAG: hypothetical protein QUS13_07995 [Smithella sp.]|nr:hypothetical protein [Smithella sp.]
MKIPLDAEIPEDKLIKYLLVKREFDDKSKFLLSAGFALENYDVLIQELRKLISRRDAVKEREGPYGVFYSASGTLKPFKGRAT